MILDSKFKKIIKSFWIDEKGYAINKKCLYLGSYKTKNEALLAYDKASKKYHKQFGVCNEKN